MGTGHHTAGGAAAGWPAGASKRRGWQTGRRAAAFNARSGRREDGGDIDPQVGATSIESWTELAHVHGIVVVGAETGLHPA